jgi:hypothetical protein
MVHMVDPAETFACHNFLNIRASTAPVVTVGGKGDAVDHRRPARHHD